MIYYGILMILIGCFFVISALRKSKFIIYQILVAKSDKIWGKNVHYFYLISGVLIIVVGILIIAGIL